MFVIFFLLDMDMDRGEGGMGGGMVRRMEWVGEDGKCNLYLEGYGESYGMKTSS